MTTSSHRPSEDVHQVGGDQDRLDLCAVAGYLRSLLAYAEGWSVKVITNWSDLKARSSI